jgi:hypothetical protein
VAVRGAGAGAVTVLTDVTPECIGAATEMTVVGSGARFGEKNTTVAAITTAITATQTPITAWG